MEIQKISAPAIISTEKRDISRDLSRLQPGSIQVAVVLEQLAENTYVIKLADGQLVRAQTPQMLTLGQKLNLEVVKAGELPELKIVSSQTAGSQEQRAVSQALRLFLPKQQSLGDFAVALRQFASVTEGRADGINALIQSVVSGLMSKEELMSAEGVKQGIQNAGVFLEAKLASNVPPQGDLKAQLLILKDNVQQFLQNPDVSAGNAADVDRIFASVLAENASALLSKTEGAIARVVLDQLASLPQNDDQQQLWQIEIPFTNGNRTDSVKLKITRDGKAGQDTKTATWSVVLELNPPGLAPLQAKISLMGDKVDTYFWSEQGNLNELVRQRFDELASRYQQAGLAVGRLGVRDSPLASGKSMETVFPSQLLDEYT